MSTPGFSQWQANGAAGLYGTATAVGGGGSLFSRSEIDASRMGIPRVPYAEYPDGYLGDVHSRRGDRLLDSLKTRQTERSYQRGVHVGSRVDPSEYFWPSLLQPDRALRNESKGLRTGPIIQMAPEPHLVNDGKNPRPLNTIPGTINPVLSESMSRLRPMWR